MILSLPKDRSTPSAGRDPDVAVPMTGVQLGASLAGKLSSESLSIASDDAPPRYWSPFDGRDLPAIYTCLSPVQDRLSRRRLSAMVISPDFVRPDSLGRIRWEGADLFWPAAQAGGQSRQARPIST
jgi:hypothetical protein